MPRQARLMLAGQPYHVTQRGVNKGAIFVDDIDRQLFLHLLHSAFLKHQVALHAYVLMGNHVHLLATPSTGVGLANAMRMQGNNYVQAFNQRHGRSGPLWQGRFHSSMVDSDAYLLSVYRYIELNPVRAGMTAGPEDHPWSSVHGNLQRRHDPMLTEHPAFQALAASKRQRTTLYGQFLRDLDASADLQAIRAHSAAQHPLGSTAYLRMVEQTLGRPAMLRKRGRPRKEGTGGLETT
ncbi:TPA: transposase [Stenotrophomonas maltophilia]|uniref:Transposase n=1 Tax=Stenotrophomonas maltophilia TaxID=40324 RepID=A0AAI9CDQ6_STEMA|nr:MULTISPECIES: transposase [Stenotrophomonas]EKT4442795.1 transposase [Stenotrophomonas maltophilia]MBN5012853.1 transposase [Stenotrophomonas maltophilia]MDV3434845.1 transposase [Stenotrophomonas sp. C2852]HDS1084429.1 transposase [Stenotrophomonas maltophilia]HDS1303676.1 transposase [Stenotrophomonas maltophilia]